MYARMATIGFSGDGRDLSRRAEEGLLPVLKSQPGFRAYSVAIADDEILSLSVWDTRDEAEAATDAIASWVTEHMPEITSLDVRYGELMFSTTLGVTTTAVATA